MTHIQFDEIDAQLREDRLAKWQARTGPRVGDFVRMPDGKLQRWSHNWGDAIQPGDGSFYFTRDGHMIMSGGLDPAIPMTQVRDTGEIRQGSCWFFHHDSTGAHRGVQCTVPCRVYEVVTERVPDAVMSAMETETDPLPDAVASAWDTELNPPR